MYLTKEALLLLEKHTGDIIRIDKSTDGLVHWVYRIEGSKRVAYLKQRRNFFRKVPQIKTDPLLIKNEVKSLKLFHSYLPDIFPKVLVFNHKENFILLSDVTRGKYNFERKLNDGMATEKDFYLLGKTTRDMTGTP